MTSREKEQVKDALREASEVSKHLAIASLTGRVNLLEKAKSLAYLLHKFGCFYSHTDGCAWGYEEDSKDPWLGHAHKQYLRIACKHVGTAFPDYIERAEKLEIEEMSRMDGEDD